MPIQLYVFPASPRAFKVLALAEHLNLDYEVRIVRLDKGEQNSAEYAALNPNKRMPVMVDDDFVLWESNAILQYLAGKEPARRLLPADERTRLDVTRWQFWDLAHWDPACATVIFERVVKQLFKLGDPDPTEVAKGEEKFHRCAVVLDQQLKGRRYITGDQLTVADFSVGACLNMTQPAQLPVASYEAVTRWYRDLTELPAWRKWLNPPPVA